MRRRMRRNSPAMRGRWAPTSVCPHQGQLAMSKAGSYPAPAMAGPPMPVKRSPGARAAMARSSSAPCRSPDTSPALIHTAPCPGRPRVS
jgi:hypothetical protein